MPNVFEYYTIYASERFSPPYNHCCSFSNISILKITFKNRKQFNTIYLQLDEKLKFELVVTKDLKSATGPKSEILSFMADSLNLRHGNKIFPQIFCLF